jgi:hypothetical protein
LYYLCGAGTVIVSKAFIGREIRVKAGCQLRVNLQKFGAVGYPVGDQGLGREHFEILGFGTKNIPPKATLTPPITKTRLILTINKGKSGE